MEKFSEQVRALAKRVETLKDSIETEEATKTAIIMPFFQMLGYDVFNPMEFNPEFTADVGIKKGEKVDYAIILDNTPVILIECKGINHKLTNHDSQLFRYFGTTASKFGILTNGIEYKFYTDLEEQNKMDSSPFFTLNLLDLKDNHINELAKFHKDNFDVNNITSTASELKYLSLLKTYLNAQFNSPSEDFVKFLVNEIYDGIKTKTTLEKFAPIIAKGLKQIVTEQVSNKLSAALKSTSEGKEKSFEDDAKVESNSSIEVITTPEELETYSIVKVALRDVISTDRIFYRDNKSYFNIIIDDSIRKWVLRAFFEKNKNYVVLNDGPTDKERTIIEFNQPIELMDNVDQLKKAAEPFI